MRDPRFKKHGSAKRWGRTHAAYVGAFLGIAITMAHQGYHVLANDFPEGNPLVHIFLELIVFSAAGALALAAVAEIRNRIADMESPAGRSASKSES
ncbi:MAG TPA: hypothetical protein VFF38_05310 [Microvirga sp.]|nr:hypothetical protein [Microvirga sp.]